MISASAHGVVHQLNDAANRKKQIMAKHKVTIMVCDNCGTEDTDLSKFQHVTVSECTPHDSKHKPKIITSRDLCLHSCIGQPGINRAQM